MDQIEPAKDLSFRIGFSGYYGHLTVEPYPPPLDRCSPSNSVPDFYLPPAFIKETPESIEKFIETEYLSPRVDPAEFTPENVGKYCEFDWFNKAKICPEVSVSDHAVLPVWELPHRRIDKTVHQKWNPSSVEVDLCGFQVQSHSRSQYAGGVSSSNFDKATSTGQPFCPGGLDGSQSLEKTSPVGATNGDWARQVINGSPVESVPCGFHQGLDLGCLKAHTCTWTVNDQSKILQKSVNKPNELSIHLGDLFKGIWKEDISEESVSDENAQTMDMPNVIPDSACSSLDDSLSAEFREFRQTADVNVQTQHKMDWATTEDGGEIASHFDELVPDMAISFPFELDTFQKQAIFYLERGDSVFVAAHTSAGKTVVAEYAFALASKHCTRAVYTAPIKTISNQKYRDFCGKFDVGLLTGDVTLRPEASCLIMTTEILRSMLYKGVDIIRDIEWVIFDEVHYVNDVERGVVWEEVIIMLPSHINIVLLSATVPNTIEFADWIGRTKKKKIFVTGTLKRPVPLEHCIFYSGELYKICESEIFIPLGLKAARDKYNKKNITPGGATAVIPGTSVGGDGSRAKSHENMMKGKHAKFSASQKHGKQFPALIGGPQHISNDKNNRLSMKSEASLWKSLIAMLSKKDFLPVVIFCFSKNRCDKSANNLYGINLTTSSEKSKIHVFCEKAFTRLNGSDRNLPQVIRVQILLQRGIGVHHAGLLPIVKEVVEMLFCQGLVKVLFSTETFAMGVNAPARTVVFDSLRKFDGREFRQLLPGEYTQMAGRAGRRGIDKVGSVVTMCRDGIPEESDLKQVIVGSAKKLESQFRLTYIMILHLLRIEELQVEDMLKRSFAEFHSQKKLPEKEQLLLLKLSQPIKAVECIKGEPQIEEYYDTCSQVENIFSSVTDMVTQSSVSRAFLTPGRVVVLKSDSDHSLGVVLKASASNSKQYIVLSLIADSVQIEVRHEHAGVFGDKIEDFSKGYMLMPKQKRGFENEYYLGSSSKGSGIINIKLPRFGSAASSNYVVKEIETIEFLYICKCKIKIDIVGLLETCNDAAYSKAVQQLLDLQLTDDKYPPALDPQKDLKLKDINIVDNYNKQNRLLQKMANNKCHGCIKLVEHLKLAKDLQKHKEEVNMLKFQMSDQALQQMPDLYGRIDVLKQIGCIDENLVVQMKGRVACGMNSGEELICTECLFENHFEHLEPEEAVAIMSAFVFQQKKASEPSLTPNLSKARQRLYDTAIELGELQSRFSVQVDPKEYANENLKFGLVQVVYEWAKGTPFVEICGLTDVPEGIIVRTIVRLDETCREFKNAASIMGNCALYKKMEVASSAIRRDIVFAASLYITGV